MTGSHSSIIAVSTFRLADKGNNRKEEKRNLSKNTNMTEKDKCSSQALVTSTILLLRPSVLVWLLTKVLPSYLHCAADVCACPLMKAYDQTGT